MLDTRPRRALRLPDYDYTQDGVYCVTLCCQHRACLFGDVVDGGVRLNRWGEIVKDCWDAIPQHFEGVELDEFVIMPNHVHGIIVINRWEPAAHAAKSVGAQHVSLLTKGAPLQATHHVGSEKTNRPHVAPGSLGAINCTVIQICRYQTHQ